MNDFTTGSISKKLIRFMIPILGALILQAMYGAVDLLIVGKFGTEAGISAVSTGSSLTQMATVLVTGLTMGITVVIGQYIGENRREKIGRVIGGGIAFFIVMTIVLMAVMLLLAPQLSGLLNAPAEAFDLTVVYVRICGVGMIFVVAYNVISGIFRGMGDSRMPLVFVAIACVVNIIGDLLFVAVFQMDVAGAALATILAQACSVVMSLIIIRRRELGFSVSLKDIKFHEEIPHFLKIGFPIALQDLLTNLSFLILCSIVNALGLEASSGYGVAQKIIAFIMLLPSALMQSEATIVAQNIGAGKPERARRALFMGMAIGAAIGTVVFLFVFFRGDIPSAWFTNNPAYIAQSANYLLGVSLEPIVTAVSFSYIGYFNGTGRTVFTMIQGLAQTFLVRVPVSWFMSRRPGVTLAQIGFAAPAATIFGIVLCTLYLLYLTKKEKKQRGL